VREWQDQDSESLDSVILKARLVSGETGERIPVKALRHTAKTLHPRAGIAPEHSAQLLGHEAESLGERVYLHHHGPSLAEAATKYETFVRRLLGDFGPVEAKVLPYRSKLA
jgi:integrase